MDLNRLDEIHLFDLRLQCNIGVSPEERQRKQEIIVNIVLYGDLAAACGSDGIADTVDYKTLEDDVAALVEHVSVSLIEYVAQQIAEVCLERQKVQCVRVCVEKPGALQQARSVGVTIVRNRK